MKLPEGFRPLPLEKLLYHFADTMPTLGRQLFQHLGLPEQDAADQIVKLEQQGLVQYAIGPNGDPACFIAPSSDSFNPYQQPEDYALAEKLVSFWDRRGKFDHRTGQIDGYEPEDAASLMLLIQTPEGPMSVVSKVAYRLHQMGLITRDALGTFRAPSKVKLMEWTSEHGICDFCGDPPKHTELVPDFWMAEAEQESVGGWATCEHCHTLIAENRRTDLLRWALEHTHAGKFTASIQKSVHKQFWEAWDSKVDAAGVGAALVDFIENRIDPAQGTELTPKMQQKTARIEAIRRLTGLTQDEMDALGKGDVLYKDIAKKLTGWRKKFGAEGYEGTQKIARKLNAGEQPVPLHLQPHWLQALDRKAEAMRYLTGVRDKLTLALGQSSLEEGVPLLSLFKDVEEDLQILRQAEGFSFNADTMHAIMVAAAKIPHEAPLRSVEVPSVRAGWYWFDDPYPVASSPISSDVTHALLWAWDPQYKEPTIRFSAYVVDEKSAYGDARRGRITFSTKWYWPLTATFHDMLALNDKWYDEGYGPNSPPSLGKDAIAGKDVHLKAVADLSLFFMQSCLWFRETVPGNPKKKVNPILTQTPGHVERHARKRFEKEFKIPATVRVIALRKSERTLEPSGATGTGHKIKVRFVVTGHPRLQRCGPGLKDEKLIWIASYPKGPDDGPFQPPRDRVFAVIR